VLPEKVMTPPADRGEEHTFLKTGKRRFCLRIYTSKSEQKKKIFFGAVVVGS
jgi:hypothetical protein